MDANDQNKILIDKLKIKFGELLFRITELECIAEIKDSEIKILNDQIKKLKSAMGEADE